MVKRISKKTMPPNSKQFDMKIPSTQFTGKMTTMDYVFYGLQKVHEQVQFLNNSKVFAGLIVIILNIAGKFVNFKLSKTMESYLKHTFSRNILVFCIAWMGSREIYVALLITAIFIILMDFVFNEKSGYCMLPETFTTHHVSLLDETMPSPEEIKQAESVLEKAKKPATSGDSTTISMSDVGRFM
jgi:hypothetical protein